MITHFTQIIAAYVPSESSKIALRHAIDLSLQHNAKLTILNVNPHKTRDGLVKKDIDEIISDRNAQYGFVEKIGIPYKEILTLEEAINADLIVMGTHGSKEVDPDWIGGNAFKVLSGSSCPVLIFPPNQHDVGFKNIVLPVADASETRQKVPLTVSLAKTYGAKVHIVIVNKQETPEVIHKLKIYADQIKKYCDERDVANTLEEIYNKNISDACVDYANKVNADLISIMSERESPTGYFMGHYAQQLVNTSSAPVLTIHSKDAKLSGEAGY
ncbi:MAG: hypothetical protein COA58_00550 [Bacteroidetes bacterium]|nr:MAG: hypothetical protein COA58_00550 [Bacteroidota bacterium]